MAYGMFSEAGIKRISIKSLGPGLTNVVVVGIIIAKQSPRIIKKVGVVEDRGVLSFTIRDSPYDFINVSCWGSEDHLKGIANRFNIGEVVDITNAKVSLRQTGEQDTRYRPSVTSPFQLSMSEHQSKICRHEGDDVMDFIPLLRLTTKPSSDFFTLADVHTNGASMRGETVDLLAAVRSVGPLRNISTKTGRKVVCRDIVIFDQTSSGLPVQIWNEDIAHRADNWRPRETVLFLADVRVEWNAYKHGMLATDGCRTIITEDPETPEAVTLRKYARKAPIQAIAILDHLANSIPDPSSIRQVMTVQQIMDRAVSGSCNNANTQFTALVYCLVTHLDLDGCTQVTTTKCSSCQLVVEESGCINLECPIGSGARRPILETSFDLRVALSDHTGTLEKCRLVGPAAERVLKCSLPEFMSMNLDAKTHLKWTLLLQRCSAQLLVLRASSERLRPLVSIIGCEVVSLGEVAAHIPMC